MQALAQCDQYLRSFGEHGTREAVFDTAGAAKAIATNGWRYVHKHRVLPAFGSFQVLFVFTLFKVDFKYTALKL